MKTVFTEYKLFINHTNEIVLKIKDSVMFIEQTQKLLKNEIVKQVKLLKDQYIIMQLEDYTTRLSNYKKLLEQINNLSLFDDLTIIKKIAKELSYSIYEYQLEFTKLVNSNDEYITNDFTFENLKTEVLGELIDHLHNNNEIDILHQIAYDLETVKDCEYFYILESYIKDFGWVFK